MVSAKLFHLSTLLLVIPVPYVLTVGICPPVSIDISPCVCQDGTGSNSTDTTLSIITCTGDQPFDLVTVFDVLAANIPPINKDFDVFYLNYPSLEALVGDGLFHDITFRHMYVVNALKLARIDPNVFAGPLETTLKRLHLRDSSLNVNTDNYTDLQVFDRLKALEVLDVSAATCPPESLFTGSHCKCENVPQEVDDKDRDVSEQYRTVITCVGVAESQELQALFSKLSTSLKGNTRNIYGFVLMDSNITRLSTGAFYGIAFQEIHIKDCPLLTTVDRDVFAAIAPFVNKLHISNVNFSDATGDEHWYALSSLPNLVALDMVNVFREIPAHAFQTVGNSTQWRLRWFTHAGHESIAASGARIHSVGSYAFEVLPNIEVINLQNNLITRIDKYAFANQSPTTRRLTIRLARNRLHSQSFAIGSFAGSRRPVRLELGQPFIGCNRELLYLNESVFSPFLDREGNQLDMGCAFAMQCECQTMKWLYDCPHHWRERVVCGPFGDLVVPCLVDVGDGEDSGVEEVSIWDVKEDYFQCGAGSARNGSIGGSDEEVSTTSQELGVEDSEAENDV
ncbi:unnamed protein product [Oppiella nova]|uniref:Uncharacterized protein n=1 Tax=Oppiella nova TaxID=334625 RepID=A0A7R9QMS2_9ACAR|nr:unnamed protein product [Oppiella nova]CAG2168902.1 unnamed protein product [Oppiella nova]